MRPVFGKGDAATMTAGNSTALTDGAAVALLAEEEEARRRGWPVLARVVDAQVAASDYVNGAGDLLLAPSRRSRNCSNATTSPWVTSISTSSTRRSRPPCSPR
nr:hypothetical protein [Tessaracoccus coleopterorum]